MKRRTIRTRSRAEWKSRLRAMSEEQKREFNETRRRSAKSGYAKRQRERDNGAPMSDRSRETPAWTLRAFGASLNRLAAHVGTGSDYSPRGEPA